MFNTWMHRNGLSLSTAAQALGLSRRMVSDYRTGQKSIPRAIWLAYLGWEATRPRPKTLPRGLPTAKGIRTRTCLAALGWKRLGSRPDQASRTTAKTRTVMATTTVGKHANNSL